MATRARRSQRRTEALSQEGIVEAAVELLDASGEGGLTFRALSGRLAPGPGAIYWHVANKGELLAAATDAVVASAVEPEGSPDSPQDVIRAVALGLFDAIDEHPWLGAQLATQLSRSPGKAVAPRIFERVGWQVQALGVSEDGWFTATSALVHYILGAAGQNAATGRDLGPDMDRTAYLDAVSTAWETLDPGDYPFARAVAAHVRDHDDRAQFLEGVALILAGITSTHLPSA